MKSFVELISEDTLENQTIDITDFLLMDTNGDEIGADAYGNHLAFSCWMCGHSVIASCSPEQRGCDEKHPVTCKGCDTAYFLDIRPHARKLYIHHV